MKELIIYKEEANSSKVVIDNHKLRFRENQNFTNDYIVANYAGKEEAFLLKKVDPYEYEVMETCNGYPFIYRSTISRFIVGINDYYSIHSKIYDETHKIVCEVPNLERGLQNNIINYLVAHKFFLIKDDIYISTNYGIVILHKKFPKIVFSVLGWYTDFKKYKNYDSSLQIIFFDEIVFNHFQISEELIEKLSKLNGINEMKEVIQKELVMNIM